MNLNTLLHPHLTLARKPVFSFLVMADLEPRASSCIHSSAQHPQLLPSRYKDRTIVIVLVVFTSKFGEFPDSFQ